MSVSNEKVVKAFFQGQDAVSYGKNFSCGDNLLTSYATPVARLLADGSVLVRSQDECPTPTTSAHANKAFLAALKRGDERWIRGARMPWDQLQAWGLSPADISSAREDRYGGIELGVREEYCLYHPSRLGAPFVWHLLEDLYRTNYMRPVSVYLGTWFKLDRRPVSSLHFARSYLGESNWEKCLRGEVFWVGNLFLEGLDNTTYLPISCATKRSMGVWKLGLRQQGDIITGPFSLSSAAHTWAPPLSSETRRYKRLETLSEACCVPLDGPVDDRFTHTLMDWP